MFRLRTFAIVALFAAGLVGAAIWSTSPSRVRDEAALNREGGYDEAVVQNDASRRTVSGLSAAESSLRSPAAPQADAVLPDPDLPFSMQMDRLIALAKDGSPGAMCRASLGLIYCGNVASKRELEAAFQRSLEARSGGNDDRAIEAIARSRELDGDFCEGVELDNSTGVGAVNGFPLGLLSARQKTVLALTRADGTLRRLVSDSPVYSQPAGFVAPDIISRNVEGFLREGFLARDPLALEGLIMLHSPGMLGAPPGAVVSLPDSELFARYATLMQETFGPESLGRYAPGVLEAVLRTMSAEAIADLARWVAVEKMRWRDVPNEGRDRRELKRFSDGRGLAELCE